MDQVEAIRAFVTTVREGGFAAAGRSLELSRSQISKLVQALEDKLGAQLLTRTTRAVQLTDVGQEFYERSVDILAALDEASEAVTSLQKKPIGKLRVNAPMAFGLYRLQSILPEFLSQYPDVELSIHLDDRFVDPIQGGYDVTIRIAKLADSSLKSRRVGKARRALYAAPSYLAAHGTPQAPNDLKHHQCLHYDYLASGANWVLHGPSGEASVLVKGPLCSNSGDLLAESAIAGHGIVLSPDFIVEKAVQSGRLVPILPDYEAPSAEIYALYPPTRRVSAKTRAFIDFLVEHLPEPAGG